MNIIFYVAGMSFNGDTIKEGKSLGGSESAGYYIAKEMAELGHRITVFSNITPEECKIYDKVIYNGIGNQTKECPLGENFMRYAQTVQHDVLIIQRVPTAFLHKFKSKLNIWWTHDLGLTRTKPQVHAQLPNINLILAVSEWHKKQVMDIYNIQERSISVLPNGVDKTHYKEKIDIKKKFNSKSLIFSSRPERGLENLVKEGGIMEKLWRLDKDIKLFVTCYNHVGQDVEGYYKFLWQRCSILPNVQLLEFMSKQDLAVIESNISFYVYPSDFEETSCITAMNSQEANTPFICSEFGALPETLKNSAVVWVDTEKDNKISIDRFSNVIFKKLRPEFYGSYSSLSKLSDKKKADYGWDKSALHLNKLIKSAFINLTKNKKSLSNHFIENSDIFAYKKTYKDSFSSNEFLDKNFPQIKGNYKEFYNKVADYNTNEIKNDHSLGNDQVQLSMSRMQPIIQILQTLPNGSNVLDYGCCVGQHTVAWATVFPGLNFVGTDISENQLIIARNYKNDNDIENVRFLCVDDLLDSTIIDKDFDLIICCEVIEHCVDPVDQIKKISEFGKRIVLTTPTGPWEKQRSREKKLREHLHHFESEDIVDMIGTFKNFFIQYVPYKDDLGTHVFGFTVDKNNKFGKIDYARKLSIQNPKQSLSTCIITINEAGSLEKTLKSVREASAQIIVGVDCKKETEYDKALYEILEKYECEYFKIPSPIEIGFDDARNRTIIKATCDWILWVDSDEELQWPERLKNYLRENNFDAYAVPQHHYSAEPAAKIKTDIPCRLFRNNFGIKFFGMVHEHPEKKLNEGIKHTFILPENHVCIMHNGYSTEAVRRKRFKRNFPLMTKDREKYPERDLGKFLWIRDLCHMNRFEFERTGIYSNEISQRSEEGLKIWREFIKKGKVRFCIDSLEYVSEFSSLLTRGAAIEFNISLGLNFIGIGDNMSSPHQNIKALLVNKKDVENLTKMMINEKLDYIPEKYV